MSAVALVVASAGMVSTAYAKKVSQNETYNYQRAKEAFMADDLEQASEWVARELADDPENGYAYALLAAMCSQLESYGDVLSMSEKALKYLPRKDKEYRAFIYSQQGASHLALKDTVAALSDYEMAIKAYPENSEYFISLAQVYSELGEYDKSDAVFDRMEKKGLDEKYVLAGRGKNAMDRKDYDMALRYFNEAIQKYPDYGHPYAFRSEIYMNQGKWTESVNDIISAYNADTPDWLSSYVVSFDKQGLPVLASRIRLEMARNPENAELPTLCALAFENSEEYADAIDWYEKALAVQPLGVVYQRLASCCMNLDDYDKALEYVDKALAMDEDDAESIRYKILILVKRGDYDGVKALCDRYMALDPENLMAYYLRAGYYMSTKQWKSAAEDYEAATFLVGDASDIPVSIMALLADALSLDGQKVRAEYYYNKVIEAEKAQPLGPESYTPLAYASLGRRQDALEAVSYINLVLEPEQESGFLYQTACVYARLGDTDKALEALSKALDKGYEDYDHILEDYDMDPLRDTPEFKAMVQNRFPKDERNGRSSDTPDPDDSLPVNGEYPIGNIEIDGYIGSQAAVRTEIPFKREDGVTKVQCSINGLPLHFVFDTGAGDVTMSLVEANFMLKNGYLKRSDIKGSARYIDANGDISEGTVINLRHINLGGVELENVRASVVRNQRAPLLLGQSVLSRLGKIEIDNPGSRLIIINPDSKKK